MPVLAHLLEKKSYKSIVTKGAIEGLKITAIESGNGKKVDDIVSILHEKCKVEEDPLIRQKAISVLGYIAKFYKDKSNTIDLLKGLLNDDSIHIRNTAYAAIGNIFEYSKDETIIREIENKTKDEDNEFVRQTAKRSLSIINKNLSPRSIRSDEQVIIKGEKLQNKNNRGYGKIHCFILRAYPKIIFP